MPRSWSYRKYERNVLAPTPKGMPLAVIAIIVVSVILLTFFIGSTIYYFTLDAKERSTHPVLSRAKPGPVLTAPEIKD